jgi:hypothetical protein
MLLRIAALALAGLAPVAALAVVIANDSEREITVSLTAVDQPATKPIRLDPGAALDLPGQCLGRCQINIAVRGLKPLMTEGDDDNALVIYKGKRAISVMEIEDGLP